MIRIAIIGTGNIANAHMRAFLRQQGRCEIAALCDLVPGKAEQMKTQYGLKADCYEDYRLLLAREDIDLVDVCAPPFLHAQASIDALRAGKNVVCEKPMAASLEE